MEASAIEFEVRYRGSPLQCPPCTSSTSIGNVKRQLCEETNILPKRQKLMGLKPKDKATKISDETLLGELILQKKDGKDFLKCMLMGTPEADIPPDIPPEDLPEIIDDLDYADSELDQHERLLRDPVVQKKLRARIDDMQIPIISAPRTEKRLLVLDIDHTIFDCRSSAPSIEQLMRPHLHEFLELVYPHYDLVFWSQTSWRWIEAKLTEMGILTSNKYSVSFVLDRTFMFSVTTNQRKVWTHEVKPLQVIWERFDHWSSRNTVHIDDLSRNFALNPSEGLKIKAFKDALFTRKNDSELRLLGEYLVHIAGNVDDFNDVDHRRWKDFRKDSGLE